MSTATESVKQEAGQIPAGTSLLDEIMSQSRMTPETEAYDIARQGVAAFISNILASDSKEEPINKLLIDKMLVELDKKLSAQMDEILHNDNFQEVESSWRSLKLLVDRTDFRENIKINIIHATKSELLEDFEFSPEIVQSGFYKHVYSAGYGQFGGEPVAAVVGNYAFSNTTPDMKLLQYVSAVGAMAHAPFLSSVSPDFFGVSSYTELPAIKDLKSVFEGPAHTKWRALREAEDSRYLGLTARAFCCVSLTIWLKTRLKTSTTVKVLNKTMTTICGVTQHSCWLPVSITVSPIIAGVRISSGLRAAVLSAICRFIALRQWANCRLKSRLKCLSLTVVNSNWQKKALLP